MKLRNKYFTLRHGQTIYQTKKKAFIYSWPDKPPVKLTKEGERQIKAAAKKLKKEKIDLIFASDFFRTRQTAEIVAKEIDINKINFDKRLRDVNLGIYHGKRKEEFYQKFPRSSLKRFSLKPAEGESWLDCQKRMLKFLKEIDKKYKNKRILIISHGDPLWLLEGAVKNWPMEKLLKFKIDKRNYFGTGKLRKI